MLITLKFKSVVFSFSSQNGMHMDTVQAEVLRLKCFSWPPTLVGFGPFWSDSHQVPSQQSMLIHAKC